MNIYEMSSRYFRRMALSKISQSGNLLTNFVKRHLDRDLTSGQANVNRQLDIAVNRIQNRIAGRLTDFVKSHIESGPTREEPSDFKAKFLKLGPGPEREKLVYDEVLKRRPFQNMVPITVPGPGGTKITYKVMPDYITIDGLRVPMSGQTAQKIANHFGMSLPTSKMTKQIWEAADTKVRPQPLSAGGTIGGKYYNGKDVVQSKISDSDSAIAYSNMIEDSLKDKNPNLVAGHMKTIVMTDRPEQLGLYGWSGDEKSFNPIQSGEHTGHDTSVHTEYGTGARLVSGDVKVTFPDGTSKMMPMENLLNNPELYHSLSDTKVKKYKVN